jgi:Ser/Thr protein kinase RdoA (MazF antagonist)
MNNIESIQKVLEQYSISEKSPINLIRESGDNFVFSIGENEKTILRLSKRLPIEDVAFEYDLIQHLISKKIPVSEIIKNNENKPYSLIEDSVVVLFKFIEGNHIEVDKDNLPSKEQAHNAGKYLGLISNAGLDFETNSPRQRDIFKEFERVLKLEDYFVNNFEGGKEFVEQVKNAINFGKSQNEKRGLIHNDYRPSNLFFSKDEVVGVIDFDWACIGPVIKDLALAVVEWSFPDGATEANFEIFDAFLAGYNSVVINKVDRDQRLFDWIKFTTLSDSSTYFCDLAEDPESTKRIIRSFMYRKYLFFDNYQV